MTDDEKNSLDTSLANYQNVKFGLGKNSEITNIMTTTGFPRRPMTSHGQYESGNFSNLHQ